MFRLLKTGFETKHRQENKYFAKFIYLFAWVYVFAENRF